MPSRNGCSLAERPVHNKCRGRRLDPPEEEEEEFIPGMVLKKNAGFPGPYVHAKANMLGTGSTTGNELLNEHIASTSLE